MVDDRDHNHDDRNTVTCDDFEEAALCHQKPALLGDGVTARVNGDMHLSLPFVFLLSLSFMFMSRRHGVTVLLDTH